MPNFTCHCCGATEQRSADCDYGCRRTIDDARNALRAETAILDATLAALCSDEGNAEWLRTTHLDGLADAAMDRVCPECLLAYDTNDAANVATCQCDNVDPRDDACPGCGAPCGHACQCPPEGEADADRARYERAHMPGTDGL